MITGEECWKAARAYSDGSSMPFRVCLKVTMNARPSPVLCVSYLPGRLEKQNI